MTDREAMQMALTLLVAYQDCTGDSRIANKCGETIEALRQALAQPEQTKCPRCGEVNPAEIHTCSPQVAQEPVAYMSIVKKDSAFDKFRFVQSDMYPTPVYTAPPPKQWVGLTDNEIAESAEHMEAVDPTDSFWREFSQEIEAKLMEKNT